MIDRPADTEGYPMRRDMRVNLVQDKTGEMAMRLECPYCEADFPYDPPENEAVMANCEIVDHFLSGLLARTNFMIEVWDSNKDRDSGFRHYCEKARLDPDDPASLEKFGADDDFLHERMDVLFDDAENFGRMMARKGNAFGYCVFVDDEKPEESPLMLAYMARDCVASLRLNSPENMETAKEYARLCRLGAPERGDIRCHELIAKMVPAKDFDGLAASWSMRPVEHELNSERMFFKPERKQAPKP